MPKTFCDLQDECAKMDSFRPGTCQDEVSYLLDAARVNADDTIYLEKAAPESDYNRIAMGSLLEMLSFSKHKKAIAWFAKRGIKP